MDVGLRGLLFSKCLTEKLCRMNKLKHMQQHCHIWFPSLLPSFALSLSNFYSWFYFSVFILLCFLMGWGHCSNGLFVWSFYRNSCKCSVVCVFKCVQKGLQFCFMHNDLIQTQTLTYRIRLFPRIV
ncbi:hypothetical protein ILYODFUR_009018 [Ilyodon furcidens]|uniref:Uncharacterized protein n=1 Tax=Ilyodon furcidens TaxID=33524 RepID=A0ABV0TIE0_9TELE